MHRACAALLRVGSSSKQSAEAQSGAVRVLQETSLNPKPSSGEERMPHHTSSDGAASASQATPEQVISKMGRDLACIQSFRSSGLRSRSAFSSLQPAVAKSEQATTLVHKTIAHWKSSSPSRPSPTRFCPRNAGDISFLHRLIGLLDPYLLQPGRHIPRKLHSDAPNKLWGSLTLPGRPLRKTVGEEMHGFLREKCAVVYNCASMHLCELVCTTCPCKAGRGLHDRCLMSTRLAVVSKHLKSWRVIAGCKRGYRVCGSAGLCPAACRLHGPLEPHSAPDEGLQEARGHMFGGGRVCLWRPAGRQPVSPPPPSPPTPPVVVC